MFDIGSAVIAALMALIVTVVVIIISMKRIILPAMENLFAEKYETAEGAIKRGFSAMGVKSQEIQREKHMEEAITEGIFEQYPEILAVASKVSPDLVELMEEDPVTALRLAKRYLPHLKEIFPDFFEKFAKDGEQKHIWEF